MNYENIAVVDESLEALSHESIITSLLGSYKTWRYIIEMDIYQTPSNPWLLTHHYLSYKWGYFGDLDLYLDEYEQKLKELVAQPKQVIKTEILLAMYKMGTDQASTHKYNEVIEIGE